MVVFVGSQIDTGWCQNCRQQITLTDWPELRQQTWTHNATSQVTCAGSPVATPAQYVVLTAPPRDHQACALPGDFEDGQVWRCPVCTVPWKREGTRWRGLDWTYVGPTRAVRDEPQA